MNYDQEYYYEKMAETYAGLTGFRPNPASDVAFRFRALAVQLSALAGQIEEARLGAFPATASGKTLDAHAALRGLSRREAGRASGMLRFSRKQAETACTIPAGCICATADEIEYETVAEGRMEPGVSELLVPAQAVHPGISGNAVAGAVCLIRSYCGEVSEVGNPEPFSGGFERETDQHLRARLESACREPNNGANRGFYMEHALACPGVYDAAVSGQGGTVTVLVAAEGDAQLSDETISSLSEQLNRLREPCTTVAVARAEVVPVRIDVEAAADAARREQIAGLLAQELNCRRIGQGCTLARLGQVIMNSGFAENYRFVLPAADLTPGGSQILRAGEIVVREMVG